MYLYDSVFITILEETKEKAARLANKVDHTNKNASKQPQKIEQGAPQR